MKEFKKYFPSGTFLVMILCLFLPFFVVKCKWQEVLSLNWMNFIWIWEPKLNIPGLWNSLNSQSTKKDSIEFNLFLFSLFLVLLVTFWFSVVKLSWKKIFSGKLDEKWYNKLFFCSTILSSLLLVLFIIDANNSLKKGNWNQRISYEYEGAVKIELWTGIYIFILILLINFIYFWNEIWLFNRFLSKNSKTSLWVDTKSKNDSILEDVEEKKNV